MSLRSLGLWVALAIGVGACASNTLPPVDEPRVADDCIAQARALAAAEVEEGMGEDEARRLLETEVLACWNPELAPATAALYGTIHANRARLALDFLRGDLTLAHYRAVRRSREEKIAQIEDDPASHAALLAHDTDRDLVLDAEDDCPATPLATPTDASGCPLPVPDDPRSRIDERTLRAVLEKAQVLHNSDCEDAPAPPIPTPIAWGRGSQTAHGTQGFNLAVTEVGGLPEGCEIFYEVHFRFFEPAEGHPASKHVTVVFSEREDLQPEDPSRVVFGLPMLEPLSAGRTEARTAMSSEYSRLTWRVRAVNGSNRFSPWSTARTQGPAPLGVDG